MAEQLGGQTGVANSKAPYRLGRNLGQLTGQELSAKSTGSGSTPRDRNSWLESTGTGTLESMGKGTGT